MSALPMAERELDAAPETAWSEPSPNLDVREIYETYFEFVWRTARRLGLREPHLDDVVQEVFMVVQRRLPDFEGRSQLRTWLFGITRHIVRAHFRRNARLPDPSIQPHELADPGSTSADEQLASLEGTRLLYALLDELDADKREVFVLTELEEMSGPEIARALDLPLSNVYARIRAAQKAFEAALRRLRARQARTR
jgi:RNA polymerase sigma-70 factor (ECF subfamily)